VQPFADNSIMPIVLLAVVSGFAWRSVRQRQLGDNLRLMSDYETLVSLAREMAETILLWMVKLVPIAILLAIAKITAEHGLQAFTGLLKFVGLCLLGMVIHILFSYSLWLLLWVRISLVKFWREALQPVIYAFAVNSSLVALPLTLKALDNLGVSRRASTLAACIGTNLNNDGIILYEGFALLAIAQASGMDLSLGTQLFAAAYCIIAAMGVAGVPEAGIVALTLVLGGLGISVETLAVLLSVDWLIARSRSFLNVTSDMVGSLVLDRWIGNSQS
jgi:DAACS family dicarboxylate/amino acid:cation (Na+ or H+) symporter